MPPEFSEHIQSSVLLEKLSAADFPKKDVSIAEAKFGFRYVSQYLDHAPAGCRVLEVGCGSGISRVAVVGCFARDVFLSAIAERRKVTSPSVRAADGSASTA